MRLLLAAPALIAAAVLGAGAGIARADTIDGDWCDPAGKHLVINGQDITLPDGAQLQGTYLRHSFAYAVPDNLPAAGTQMILRMLNEQTMIAQAYRGGVLPVTWKRCEHLS